MRTPLLRRYSRLLLFCTALLGVAFVLLALRSAAPTLRDLALEHPAELAGSIGLLLLAVVWSGCCWAYLIKQLGGPAPGQKTLVAIFLTAWPTRYVPGTLPYHMMRLLMAERAGVGRGQAAASSVYELFLAVGSATALGFIALVFSLGGHVSGLGYGLGMAPFLLAPILIQRRILVPLSQRAFGLAGRPGLNPDYTLTGIQGLISTAMFVGVHVLNGLAFVVLMSVITDLSVSPILLVGTYSVACAAGVVVPLVPGGLGVREAVLTGLLSQSLPPETALVAAGSIRAVSIVADLIPAVLALAFQRRANHRPVEIERHEMAA